MSVWKRLWGWAGVVALPAALLYVYRTDIDVWLGVHGWQLARFLFWSALVWWGLWGLATVVNSRYEPRTAWEREPRRPPRVPPPPSPRKCELLLGRFPAPVAEPPNPPPPPRK